MSFFSEMKMKVFTDRFFALPHQGVRNNPLFCKKDLQPLLHENDAIIDQESHSCVEMAISLLIARKKRSASMHFFFPEATTGFEH